LILSDIPTTSHNCALGHDKGQDQINNPVTFIRKPIEPEELLNQMVEALDIFLIYTTFKNIKYVKVNI